MKQVTFSTSMTFSTVFVPAKSETEISPEVMRLVERQFAACLAERLNMITSAIFTGPCTAAWDELDELILREMLRG